MARIHFPEAFFSPLKIFKKIIQPQCWLPVRQPYKQEVKSNLDGACARCLFLGKRLFTHMASWEWSTAGGGGGGGVDIQNSLDPKSPALNGGREVEGTGIVWVREGHNAVFQKPPGILQSDINNPSF